MTMIHIFSVFAITYTHQLCLVKFMMELTMTSHIYDVIVFP